MRTALLVLSIVVLTSLFGGALLVGYWVLAQADPEIVEPKAPWVHRSTTSLEPVTEVRPGESVWVVREHLGFNNKTSAEITRAFICEGGYQFMFPPIPPPTVTTVPTTKRFPLVIPKEARGQCYYHVAAVFWKNPLQPKVRRPFRDVPITVVP